MTAPACAHLHVHSEYSLLDGAAKIDALAGRAAAYGQPALGLTDHGVMNGAVEHFLACRKHGIKPISGCEIYLVDDHANRAPGRVERNHLTLLARSDAGFANLVKLSSAGFLEGLHRGKPSLDMGQLAAHSEGIIALTGCLASRFCQRLIDDNPAEARAHADDLMEVFGRENVYFEVQKNGIAEQDKANEGIVRIAREVGRPLVGTGDVHYLGREDYHHHAALLCVQTKSTLAAPSMSFDTNEFFLKNNEEMAGDFAEWPEALASSVEIAERCELEIELDKQLIPRFLEEGHDEGVYLRERVLEGLRERFGDPLPGAAVERMEMELGVIGKMGFDAYFLIVWDFVKWAKDNGVAVGPGRGSAAGSLVAYALRITDLDPLHHGLLFERFLNPERVSMPDIDIDFSVKGRERVMQYVVEKYGRESVAQIITFGKMLPRAATKDAARVLGHDYGVGDRLAKLIPDPEQGRSPTFAKCLEEGEDLRKAYDEDPTAKQVIDVARGLEGVVRNNSIHAAAVVIAGMPLTDVVPLQLADARAVDEHGNKIYKMVTQYSMKPIEMLGLLKMDFLGLRNLDVIEAALDIIERSGTTRPDMDTLPMDDATTYEMLAAGDSVGVFQFESEGMQAALRQVKPTEFNDLVALVALYRPGAMDQIPTYARGKRSPENVEMRDERLESIIGDTYGVILYQEQAMQISKALGGFSGAMADDLRKAIGKKNREAMAKLEPEFRAGCQASGTSPAVIDWLWETNQKSADYSFNKCLSSETRVITPDGERLRLSTAYSRQVPEIMAMWADGEVRPHRIQRIVKTGRKPVYRLRCASGRQVKATAEHRFLSTEGYLPVERLAVGMELITTPMVSEAQREARRTTMTRLARSPERAEWDRAASVRMKAQQAARPPEELVAHMQRMHALHPDMTRAGVAAMHERVKWLWANDPDWRKAQVERTIANVRAAYDTGPGYGHCSIASNGMWCASWPEREMCEWLVEQGTPFEMHKVLDNGRICDFYFDGVYWEMDGMDRSS
ncbi:MAG: DNA polymerase III subunit alpha, partial [Solirubrobacterales bacterium]|nr:DNA polymerase III subunit alpha [Solirubrobacterales bacterium]